MASLRGLYLNANLKRLMFALFSDTCRTWRSVLSECILSSVVGNPAVEAVQEIFHHLPFPVLLWFSEVNAKCMSELSLAHCLEKSYQHTLFLCWVMGNEGAPVQTDDQRPHFGTTVGCVTLCSG